MGSKFIFDFIIFKSKKPINQKVNKEKNNNPDLFEIAIVIEFCHCSCLFFSFNNVINHNN